MDIFITKREEILINEIFQSIANNNTVEGFLADFMKISHSLLQSETYGCFIFNNGFTERTLSVDNNPSDYSKAYFNGLIDLDMLFSNVISERNNFPNYQQLVYSQPDAQIFFNESNKIKKHGDYCYRPLRFRGQIIGFYGYVLPEKGKNTFSTKDLSIMNMIEPCVYNGISQSLMKEKMQMLDQVKGLPNKTGIFFLYPEGMIDIPKNTNWEIICDALKMENVNSLSIRNHPIMNSIIDSYKKTPNSPSFCCQLVGRSQTNYTVRIMTNPNSKMQSNDSFIYMISIEKDSSIYSYNSFSHNNQLTVREQDIMKSIIRGLSNREISEYFGIAESTVKRHISHIFEKTECKNRTQLILSYIKTVQ
ncbi:MAG: helix-turn-helix transcriptional regulator [Spirochaetales bacterium]|nr:helix-turn-helix transcriptional regulator [Spirochaetales bacterium]